MSRGFLSGGLCLGGLCLGGFCPRTGTSSPCISVGIEAGKGETSFAGVGTASFFGIDEDLRASEM